MQVRPNLALAFFITQTCVNWFYVLWVKSQPIINNAWFVLTPLIGYFYFTFAFIAAIWMYSRKAIGLNLAYCVLMFGSAIDVLSYSLVYRLDGIIETLIVPLVVVNLCVVFYMAYNQSYFKSKD
jgi:hypothetical protein